MDKSKELNTCAEKVNNAASVGYSADYILCKALDVGENILRCGGEPNRIEDTVTRICTAYGAVHTDVFALPSLVIAGVRMADGSTSSQVRRVYNTANNMHRLDVLNDISRKICSGEVSLEEIDGLIKDAVAAKPFNKYLTLLAGMLGAGGFAVFFGGSLLDGCAAAIAGLIVTILNLNRAKIGNKMLHTVVVSFVGAMSALAIVKLGIGSNIDMVMIGTIMLLIPGLAFGNAVRDLLFGDTVSGVIQFTQAILTAVMVAFGFIVAILIFGGVFN
ncbi:MAG: threonine/serine exporter family protein [Clostridia bacterium]|nr:threonine/serine exporter family protein [Clostridia bacterium]